MSIHVLRVLAFLVLASGSVLSRAEGFGPNVARSLQQRPADRVVAAPEPCPSSDAEWQTWRDGRIKALLAMKEPSALACAGGQCRKYLDADDVLGVSTSIADRIDECAKAGHAAPASVVGNLAAFSATQRNANYNLDNPTHQFGHGPGVDDEEYLRRAEVALKVPCLLSSPEFLQKISVPRTYRAALAMIEAQNRGRAVAGCPPDGQKWMTLVYRSQFLGTPDDADSYGRLLVVVPGATHDRWIQFGVWLPEDHERYYEPIKNVSVVAIASGPKPRADGRFDALVDWWRVPNDAGQLELQYKLHADPRKTTGNCQECHKTVPIGIHPARVYEFRGDRLRAVDGAAKLEAAKKLQTYVLKNYKREPVYDTGADDSFALARNFGPAFGPDATAGGPARTPASVAACTARHRLSATSVARVIENMNCAGCHNGRNGSYGRLNFPMATEKRRSMKLEGEFTPNLIESHIRQGVMPIDRSGKPVQLTRPERGALFDCLSEEYFDPDKLSGVFVDWLRNKDPAAAAPATPVLVGARALAASKRKPGPAVSGSADYDKNCLQCHPKKAGVAGDGPSLFGVYARAAASVPKFAYSADMAEAGAKGVAWDEASLMEFLPNPDAFLQSRLGHAAASDMLKRYPDESLRRSIVQYLKTLN